jgi:hypothetical protein
VAEVLEQYLSASDAFLENMRGRMEAACRRCAGVSRW